MSATIAKSIACLFGLLAVATSMSSTTVASQSNGIYTLPNWFEWDQGELDIVVVPPATGHVLSRSGEDPVANQELAAVIKAITVWEDAIVVYGEPWLQAGVSFNIYVLGQDLIPPEVLAEPNIVMASHGIVATNIAAPPTCIATYGVPLGHGVTFSIATHEFGHCLGLEHTVDREPPEDIMSGGMRVCPSNLNILAVESAFAEAFNEPGGGKTVSIPADDYEQTQCSPPW